MKLASSFTVPAAADKVVALFLDPTTMRSCIPGCEELVQTDETRYKGSLVNEVAHVRFKAAFTAEITSMSMSDNTAQPAVVRARLRGELRVRARHPGQARPARRVGDPPANHGGREAVRRGPNRRLRRQAGAAARGGQGGQAGGRSPRGPRRPARRRRRDDDGPAAAA